jgi:hypothetical protein
MIWVEVGVVAGVTLMAVGAGVMIVLMAGIEVTSVEQKAVALLQPWLSPEQAEQYSSYRYFEVIGSDTGKRYRIRDEIVAKARDLVAPVFGAEKCNALIDTVFKLEEVRDIRELRPLLQA